MAVDRHRQHLNAFVDALVVGTMRASKGPSRDQLAT
jgi:hypothetical protein